MVGRRDRPGLPDYRTHRTDETRRRTDDTSRGAWMRHTEFWARMEQALGPSYARTWAREHVLAELDERTVEQALDAGLSPKRVWAAVWQALGLPASER
jgi:hypothetical protein